MIHENEKDLFVSCMNRVFESAPYSKREEKDKSGLRPFLRVGLRDYIMSLYPLFQAVLHTEVKFCFKFYSSFPIDSAEQAKIHEKIAKFLVTVIVRGLRQGSSVDRYLKDLSYIPDKIDRLLKVKNERILLANNDINSLTFKLAILSAIDFMNEDENKLFELKIWKWEEDNS